MEFQAPCSPTSALKKKHLSEEAHAAELLGYKGGVLLNEPLGVIGGHHPEMVRAVLGADVRLLEPDEDRTPRAGGSPLFARARLAARRGSEAVSPRTLRVNLWMHLHGELKPYYSAVVVTEHRGEPNQTDSLGSAPYEQTSRSNNEEKHANCPQGLIPAPSYGRTVPF